MIHLTIRAYQRDLDGESIADLGEIIDERDITLGEALELILGKMWSTGALGNIFTGFERLKVRELAVSCETYCGPRPAQNDHLIRQPCHGFWYSFTQPDRDLASQSREWEEDHSDLWKLRDALVVYALHFSARGSSIFVAPEIRHQLGIESCAV